MDGVKSSRSWSKARKLLQEHSGAIAIAASSFNRAQPAINLLQNHGTAQV
jgi:hypothetical protein